MIDKVTHFWDLGEVLGKVAGAVPGEDINTLGLSLPHLMIATCLINTDDTQADSLFGSGRAFRVAGAVPGCDDVTFRSTVG